MRSLPPAPAQSPSFGPLLFLMAATLLSMAALAGAGCDESSGNLAAGTAGSDASGTGSGSGVGGGACNSAADCPMWENECGVRNCKGVCGVDFSPADTKVKTQVPGDCLELLCDGEGEIIQVPDDGDPADDDNDCTADLCENGVPTFPPRPEGTECDGDSTCNAVGICIECVLPDECEGRDDFCQTRTCIADQCGFDFTPAGTPLPMQVPGDCLQDVCDGNGDEVTQNADTDVSNDMNPCTADTCDNGTPVHTPTPGVSCGSGKMCNDQGNCI